MTIAILYGGSRPNGNTETLTKLATQELAIEEIYLKDYLIMPIMDKRHEKEGFSEINDDYNSIIDRILLHDVLIFSTPIYWYGMTGTMKNFIDRWSQTMRDIKYPNFKSQMSQKKGYVIAVGGDMPHIKALPLMQQFQYIFDFIGATFDGYIIGEGNKPGEIFQDNKALNAAKQLREKLK